MNGKLAIWLIASLLALPVGARAEDAVGVAVVLPGVGGDGPQAFREEARALLATIVEEHFEVVPTPDDESLQGCVRGPCTATVRQMAGAQLGIGLTVWTEGGAVREVVVTIEDGEHRYHGPEPLAGRTLEVALREATGRAVAKLEAGPGTVLSVDGSPADASVYIDGELRGRIPWRDALRPGSHEVRVSADGHRDARRTVEIPPDQDEELTLRVDLEPLDDAPPAVTTSDSWPSWLLAGGLLAGSIGAAIAPVWTLATEGECVRTGPVGCQEQVRFDAGMGTLLGLSGALLVGAVMVAITQPITIGASVSPQSARIRIEGSF